MLKLKVMGNIQLHSCWLTNN